VEAAAEPASVAACVVAGRGGIPLFPALQCNASEGEECKFLQQQASKRATLQASMQCTTHPGATGPWKAAAAPKSTPALSNSLHMMTRRCAMRYGGGCERGGGVWGGGELRWLLCYPLLCGRHASSLSLLLHDPLPARCMSILRRSHPHTFHITTGLLL
jgi:hypothetical protein